jgi:hypothetical protein
MSIKIKIGNTKAYKKALKQLDDLIETQLNQGIKMPPKNPKRIKRMLKVVEKYWEKNPDLRLGQLIGNMSVTNDSYFMSDELLEQSLVKALKQLKIK